MAPLTRLARQHSRTIAEPRQVIDSTLKSLGPLQRHDIGPKFGNKTLNHKRVLGDAMNFANEAETMPTERLLSGLQCPCGPNEVEPTRVRKRFDGRIELLQGPDAG